MVRIVVICALALVGTSVAFGPYIGTAYALESVTVELEEEATFLENGQAVEVEVEVACAPGREVLEAFVYVVQDGNQSQFAGIPVKCRKRSRAYVVRIAAFPDSPFRPGEASATAYVLVYDPRTGTTQSGGDSRTIDIR